MTCQCLEMIEFSLQPTTETAKCNYISLDVLLHLDVSRFFPGSKGFNAFKSWYQRTVYLTWILCTSNSREFISLCKKVIYFGFIYFIAHEELCNLSYWERGCSQYFHCLKWWKQAKVVQVDFPAHWGPSRSVTNGSQAIMLLCGRICYH